MPVIISLLRGINLGRRQISMEKLRELYESIGHQQVQTYIRSGNVVSRTKEKDLSRITKKLEGTLEKEFGFCCSVVLRSAAEMREVIAHNPFAKRKDVEPGKLLVNFLAAQLSADAIKQLEAMDIAPEELHVVGREMFIYFPNGQARPKLKWQKVDKILRMVSTGRNLNTVQKLLEMAEKAEQA